jgi:hypothetical protein
MKHTMMFSVLFAACLWLFTATMMGQSTTTGDLGTSARKVIWKTTATPPSYGTHGLETPGGTLSICTVDGGYPQRAFFQWSLPDQVIPDGCTIDSVRLRFTAPPNGHNNALVYYIMKIPFDLTSSVTDSAIFVSASEFANQLYDGQYNPDYTVDLKWRGPTTLIAQAISGQLSENRFTLGLKANGEGVYQYNWRVQDWTVQKLVLMK